MQYPKIFKISSAEPLFPQEKTKKTSRSVKADTKKNYIFAMQIVYSKFIALLKLFQILLILLLIMYMNNQHSNLATKINFITACVSDFSRVVLIFFSLSRHLYSINQRAQVATQNCASIPRLKSASDGDFDARIPHSWFIYRTHMYISTTTCLASKIYVPLCQVSLKNQPGGLLLQCHLLLKMSNKMLYPKENDNNIKLYLLG